VVDLHGSIEIVGMVPVLSLSGAVDLATVAQLRDLLLRLAAEHPGQRVAVGLDGVSTLDDTGLGVLLGAAGRARQSGGEVVIVCGNDHVRDRFTLTGLDRAVLVVPSVASLGSATLDESGDNEVFHIALADDWAAAQASGEYTTSTRGRTLADEGFIHCSFADQVETTADRFYRDVTDAVVLRIDWRRLTSRVLVEDLLGTGERFPHIYGPIPVTAVVDVRPLRPSDGPA
jgi:anti-anti-sigma factor